jgi:integrase
MGVTVRERPKGSGIYWVCIHQSGHSRIKKIGRDKSLAEEVARKISAQIVLGELTLEQEKKVPTFSEYAKRWIEVTVPALCKPSTGRDYHGLLDNHILPVFGSLKVNEISRMRVKEFLMKKFSEGFAPSTLTHMKNALSGVLNMAVDDETLTFNPAQRLGKVIRNKGLQVKVEPLTREELAFLLEAFKTKYPVHYPLVLTLARTGMRIGEAMGLKWKDIDFNARFITIQRNISRGHVETPKSGKIRRIDMSRQLTKVLQELLQQRMAAAQEKGLKEIPEWVFVSEAGTILDSCNWRKRVFNKVLQQEGLRKIHPHLLRHTYASFLIQAGVSLAYIRDQLGHHSIKVTVDIYGHLAPGGNKEAVDALDDPVDANQVRPNIEAGLINTIKPAFSLAKTTRMEHAACG